MKRKPKAIVSPDEARIAERLANARHEIGMTQEALAAKAGLSRSAVLRYEQGKALPGALELTKLANALGKTPNFLLGGAESFFQSQEPKHFLASDDPQDTILAIALCLAKLDREVRESISAHLITLVRAKLTKDKFAEFEETARLLRAQLPSVMSDIGGFADHVAGEITKPRRKR